MAIFERLPTVGRMAGNGLPIDQAEKFIVLFPLPGQASSPKKSAAGRHNVGRMIEARENFHFAVIAAAGFQTNA
ncbi:hypothetical protein [Neorhizobium petrolearium]|uniref:Uncharacterized protein n=1 Tax=Neorhizobium petrolearium TaxID=515361 RepID=A0ABY8MDC7_9HYPH|nr:hypothetical protein [Neorhizobium petrolearium]MCC2613573.1 hypothetical protein [Neorhizobium petrolearium]WGI71891.1 hypothetical protein QEO92_27480 [Neorhizobium petrolearium]